MFAAILLLSVGLVAASSLEKRATYATGLVSHACLDCICKLESGGCRPIGCNMDEGTLSCGYFQIKEPYWIDCGRPGSSWKACADDLQCASQCIQNYMKRYASHYHCPMTCEGYAREHNGGPQGCHHTDTLHYWHNVKRQPGCGSVH
ncbi:invertebrate-type lysozyme-like [Mercenaria mercenaria]|uniref:invertebrate-type lysozyme-like n=1 Tax=Mercenaria mercenaria TaxID=6596 RepID=UPI00234E56B6|nr:invertebrate-type lysozyme-like [Mercenaria mercenaria]